MNIHVVDKKLKQALNDESVGVRLYGRPMYKKIMIRVAALAAARSLADFWPPKSKPERCHRLVADKSGLFSMDVKQPFRILFREHNEMENLPAEISASEAARPDDSVEHSPTFEQIREPHPSSTGDENTADSNELERWKAVRSVDLVSIEDTHG